MLVRLYCVIQEVRTIIAIMVCTLDVGAGVTLCLG